MRLPTILLVEDNPGDAALLRMFLKEARIDATLIHLDDGESAMAFIRGFVNDPHSHAPDLTLLDLHIPRVDGLRLLSEIRSLDALAAMPVVILSGSVSPHDKFHALSFPGTTFIGKPFHLSGWAEFVNHVIEQLSITARLETMNTTNRTLTAVNTSL